MTYYKTCLILLDIMDMLTYSSQLCHQLIEDYPYSFLLPMYGDQLLQLFFPRRQCNYQLDAKQQIKYLL